MKLQLHWYDISGEQTINTEIQSIEASFIADSEYDATHQFWTKFPYARILSIRKIESK